MDTFTLRLPRWPILLRLLRRCPLVRTTDRIEALVFVLAVAVTLLAAPITAAVGTAVYDSSRHVYAEQAHTRHTVTATVTDVPATQIVRTGTTTVSARWTAAGTEHTGTVKAQSTAKPGETIEIWVDNNGTQVPAPTPTTRAAAEAAMVALVIWIIVAAFAAILFTVTRAACDRIRFTGWQHDLDSMGRQRRRASVSRPHFGTVMLLTATPYADTAHAYNVVLTAASTNDIGPRSAARSRAARRNGGTAGRPNRATAQGICPRATGDI